jgi:predicted alpha/beta-hydrolase family hydrolase
LRARRAKAEPRPQAAVLLTPGASADRNQSALVAIDQALSEAGIACERIDLSSRLRPPKAIEVVAAAAAALADRAGVSPERVVLGGRSFGGRMCSMAAAEGVPALGLALLSYPLHPPGRPDKLRTEHFPALSVPCLFVSGTRDPFGTPAELQAATAAIPGPVVHHWIEGAGHSPRGRDSNVAGVIAEWMTGLIGSTAS